MAGYQEQKTRELCYIDNAEKFWTSGVRYLCWWLSLLDMLYAKIQSEVS